jgi:multidrug efflux system membrane fusion protein
MTFIQNYVPERFPSRGLLRRWWIWLLAAALLGIVAYTQLTKSGQTTGGSTKPGSPLPVQSVPVTAVAAKQGDISIYLTGLGSVTPLRTVTVKSRVDGELTKVSYREGQIVRRDISWRKSTRGRMKRN